jgi:hypothetical protein
VELIQRLVVNIEQRQVLWPRAWEVLTDELKRYEYAIGPSGAITYSAPSGFHDDYVIALALAKSACYAPRATSLMAPLAHIHPEHRLRTSLRTMRC